MKRKRQKEIAHLIFLEKVNKEKEPVGHLVRDSRFRGQSFKKCKKLS